MTVLELLNLSAGYLEQKGIESPRLNSEIFLSAILKCKRLELYLSYDKPLKPEELNKMREFIKRRSQFEPLQYITGSVEFYGLDLKVTPDVLIPRPETEILIDSVIKEYSDRDEIKILDVGTGSGNIAVALAKNLPLAEIVSIDNNEKALEVARENALNHSIYEKIKFINADIRKNSIFETEQFDLIVSNPPYVSAIEFEDLQPEIKFFEPRSAVTDEENGLLFFHKITSFANKKLKHKGKIFFEVGAGQSLHVKKILSDAGFRNIKTERDYLNVERIVHGILE